MASLTNERKAQIKDIWVDKLKQNAAMMMKMFENTINTVIEKGHLLEDVYENMEDRNIEEEEQDGYINSVTAQASVYCLGNLIITIKKHMYKDAPSIGSHKEDTLEDKPEHAKE